MPTLKQQFAAAIELSNKINSIFSVGDKVRVIQDDARIEDWVLRSKCTILDSHSAVIWPDSKKGCYAAERVMIPKKSNGEDFPAKVIRMFTNPVTGEKCREYGWKNDSNGEIFQDNTLYVAIVDDSSPYGYIIVPAPYNK